MRLLLVDNEKSFVQALKEILVSNRYTVECAYDGEEALAFLENEKFDCLLLDIMMPHVDGYTVLETIRKKGDKTPVIFLSAKSDVDDKVKGFDLGGDDYLSKPFASKELLVRLKAILRRKDGLSVSNLSYEGLILDTSAFTLNYEDNKVALSSKEYQLMEIFLRRPEHIHSSETLMKEAWSIDSYSDVSSLWVFISNLRKKLREIHSPFTIKSERGLGYRLEKTNVQ